MKRSLGAIQRWMQGVVIGKPTDELQLDAFIKSPNIGARSGMGIYIHAYRSRLIECMKKEYPVLMHAIGEKAFQVFAEDYLVSCPPRSYTLALLGERFPQYLIDTRPKGRNAPWEDFIIELASLERIFFEVFDAPGSEGKTLRGSLDNLMAMRVVPVPCLRLLAFKYPVNQYFVEVKKGRSPDIPRAKNTFLAVSRRDYVVRFSVLTRKEFELLTALIGGLSLGEASRKTGSKKISKYMADWMDKKFFLELTDKKNKKN